MSIHLIDRLIDNFSINNLISFLASKLSGFQGGQDDYSHYLNHSQSEKYSEVYKVGETILNGNEQIIAITAKTTESLTERSGKKVQYDIAKTILKDEKADLAFFVFHDIEGNFRFSIVHAERENGKTLYSTFKRYTYYVSKQQTNKTFREQVGNANLGSIDGIVKAFNVEKLNKEFYNELSNWYFWATKKVVFPDDAEKNEEIRNATSVIRLITRLIFVWFLKHKKLVPNELFDKAKIDEFLNYSDKTGSTYYKAILQNLFFATLNTEMVESKRKFVHRQTGIQGFYRYERFFSNKSRFLELTRNIPFLNGGLFENLDKNAGEPDEIRIDCFSNRRDLEEKLVVPDYLFFGETSGVNLNDAYGDKNHTNINIRGIIDILNSYNFTIEENNPVEVEVALDPELLGKAFENLLASYNPETQTTARKQSGSFYTPREIVDYICDESLLVYLKEILKNTVSEEDLRNLTTYNNREVSLTDTEKEELIKAIDNCKILDPACGSGAFPMGILQKMVFILQKLDPENKQWKLRQEERAKKENKELVDKLEKDIELINKVSSLPELKKQALSELELRLQQIEKAFELNTNELDYARKLYLIENCIYGVDIQPIAIQISKLRFFISLLVEQTVDNTQENRGIIPMPNMETKFVAANTLISLSKENIIKPQIIYPLEVELKEVRHRHFSARTPETKKKYRLRDKELRGEISDILINAGFPPTSANQIAEWNPYDQNISAEWFDSEWMFGITDGFDIVIGNPPYIQLQNNGGKFAKLYEKEKYKTFARTGDIYCLFYERGWQLLKPKGHLCFITSNKWMRAGYGENTRKFFAENTNPEKLIDFAGVKVFESATVDTNILMFSKDKNRQQTEACVVKKEGIKELSVFIRQSATNCNFSTSESWVVLSAIEQKIKQKIEAIGTPLKDWDIQINYGIKTGFNEAFIISGEKRKELIEQDPKSAEIIRPLLRGRDIKRYSYEFADLYLITTFPSLKIDIEQYPAVKQHLMSFGYDRLKQTGETGARKKTNNKWFETQDTIGYWEDFYKQKIVYIEIMTDNPEEGYDFPAFSFDSKGCILLNTAYMMSGKPSELKYILSILNSKLGRLLVKLYVTQLQNRQFRMLHQSVINFPIPKIMENEMERFNQFVGEILSDQMNELVLLKTNQLVYELYNLTSEEIQFIESL